MRAMRPAPDITRDPGALDDEGTLRVPLPLAALMVFEARYLIMLPLAALTDFLSRGAGMGDPVLPPWLLLPASLPALAVLVAWARRRPRAGRLARAAWARGRGLLAGGAVLDLALLAPVAAGGGLPGTLVILMALGSLYGLIYLLRSTRVPAVFADFPETEGR